MKIGKPLCSFDRKREESGSFYTEFLLQLIKKPMEAETKSRSCDIVAASSIVLSGQKRASTSRAKEMNPMRETATICSRFRFVCKIAGAFGERSEPVWLLSAGGAWNPMRFCIEFVRVQEEEGAESGNAPVWVDKVACCVKGPLMR